MYQKRGDNPYWNWNAADETFIKDTDQAKDIGGRLGNVFFRGKRAAAKAGFLGSLVEPKRAKAGERVESWSRDEVPSLKSLPNLPSSTNTMDAQSDGQGSGNDGALKETPIDPVQWVERGPPNYTYASLPYRLGNAIFSNNSNEINYAFRMTSPYDCTVGLASSDVNAGAGTTTVYAPIADASDSTYQEARWFNFYAGLYKYYHVVACKYRFTLENYSNDDLWVHQMYYNDTMQPSGAGNDDILLWPGVKSYYVKGISYDINSSGYANAYDIPSGDNDEDVGMVVTAPYASSKTNGKWPTNIGHYEKTTTF